MKKSIIKVLSVVIVVVITLTSAPLSGFVGIELPKWLDFSINASAATSGTCGENVTWTFSKTYNKLTISGSGAMYDYDVSMGKRPWEDYSDLIYEIVIGNQVTSIGKEAFRGFPGLVTVVIGGKVTSIGCNAFSAHVLSHVIIPKSVKTIGDGAFDSGIEEGWEINVYYNGTSQEWDKIKIGSDNADLINATFFNHFAYCNKFSCIPSDPNVENVVGATCYATGSYDNVVYCVVCEKEVSRKTITVPKTSHTETTLAAVASTCTSSGYTAGKACSACGKTLVAPSTVPALGHNFHNSICTRCGISENNGNNYKDYENITVKYLNKGNITLNFKQEWFANDSNKYNHNIAILCSQFSTLGYDSKKIKSHLKAIGFEYNKEDDIIWKTEANEKQVDNFIARRDIAVNGKVYTLLFVGCIGTNTVQWYSNFKPGTGETHASFNDAKNYVYNNIKNYITKNNIDTTKTKILLCGHSRGAATANLLGAQLIDEEKFATKENIYTYTFATPNPTSSTKAKDSKYSRIFNIVNPEDFVTKVLPAQWKYRRYGTTYVLPSKTNTSNYKNLKSNMQKEYEIVLSGQKYHPYPGGEKQTYDVVNTLTSSVKNINQLYEKIFYWLGTKVSIQEFFTETLCKFMANKAGSETRKEAQNSLLITFSNGKLNSKPINVLTNYFVIYQGLGGATGGWIMDDYFQEAHQAETYCAYMMSMTASQASVDRKGYKNSVNCPVDVEVYEKSTGELVGRIVNNVVDEDIAARENSIVMSVDGDSKSFWLPSDGEYDVKLIGNDNGTMDYTVAEVDGDSVETTRVNFVDVKITDNKSMSGYFLGDDFVLKEYSLTTEDNETIESDDLITLDNADEYKFDVAISTVGMGFATGDGTFTKGDYVIVSASTDELNEFLGWYVNGKRVSTDAEYGFVAQNDVELTAKFTNNTQEPEYNYIFEIKQPSRTEIRNKDGIILHAKVDDTAPNGSYVRWESSNGNFDKSADGSNLKIIAKNKGYTTFTAILCDADGNELARDSVEMYSKSGFLDKIGGFFRGLFGLTKIYEN